MARQRKRISHTYTWAYDRDGTLRSRLISDDEVERKARQSVHDAAMRQIVGAQSGEGKLFKLERDVPADDMEYVRASLGVRELK